VPYVGEGVEDDDEVLLVMAEQLGGMIDAVGGTSYCHVLLDPLEALASVEETTVREMAVASLNAVLCVLAPELVLSKAWPMVQKLGERDWLTSRTSACSILPLLYTRLPEQDGASARMGAFDLFNRLCSSGEEVPVVRRTAALEFPAFAAALAGGTLTVTSDDQGKVIGSVVIKGKGVSKRAAEPELSVMLSAALGTDVEAAPLASSPPITVSASSEAAGGGASMRLLPLAQGLTRDSQDGVRMLAVNACVALSRLANGGMTSAFDPVKGPTLLKNHVEVRAVLAAALSTLASDAAWRVRWSVAHRLGELASALGPVHTSTTLLPILEGLLRDAEAEVRCAAVYRAKEIAALVKKETTCGRIMPALTQASHDASDHVRAALASIILDLPPILGPDATAQLAIPIFLSLFRDRSPHVRLNVIAKLDGSMATGGEGGGGGGGTATQAAGAASISLPSLMASISPSIQELSEDKSWRVRLATISFTPGVMCHLGKELVGSPSGKSMVDMVTSLLADPVFAVREAAASSLKRLTELFGGPWADSVLLPRVLSMIEKGGARKSTGMESAGGAGALGVDGVVLPPNTPPSQLRMTGVLALMVSECRACARTPKH